MRYANIDNCEIVNGEDIGATLYVQGCHRHCKNCFNPETWDFNGGKEWNDEVKNQFLALIDRPYIKRVTILGGEPLAYENLPEVYDLVKTIKEKFPDKKIWLYTGYELSCGINERGDLVGDFANADIGWDNGLLSNHIVRACDVVVDGDFRDELKDYTLQFRGSSNQRLIDVQKTISQGQIVLWGEHND
ncbi:ribonucleoside-triphosphate reductase [Ruminococcus albus SY3]|uniref:Anaerobic ribonucleoside-triphosphate reductase-activating protein n=1 Tax=Ruminococcus albus SY3 TaxID=1341156 RepID=A0A011UAM7_RUMAL|nr:anaerobic ribonucleoside-triphosphate reductase activating protein [Ruminococcus albus]EXM37664.1 ribonucleoside-triphosphate reductase [Ruminococcus albus SY3]